MINELHPIVEKYSKMDDFEQYQGKYDFHGKTPVWICWWQGYENMPPIVKACVNRICKSFDDEIYEIVLITEKNYGKYIDLPKYVLDKFENKYISIQAFSDVLRWGIMAHYGGIWMDSTVYVMYDSYKEIEWQLKFPFFTQRFNSEVECPNEPCRGKWCNFYFMGQHEENIRIFQFVYDSILYYWNKHDMAFNYVWLDYILWTAYSKLRDIHDLIDNVPANNKNMWDMKLNEVYSDSLLEHYRNNNEFYKLTYKGNWTQQNNEDKLTVYGYLIRENSSLEEAINVWKEESGTCSCS